MDDYVSDLYDEDEEELMDEDPLFPFCPNCEWETIYGGLYYNNGILHITIRCDHCGWFALYKEGPMALCAR